MLSKATITVAIAIVLVLGPLSAEATKSFLAPDSSKHSSLTKKAFQADIMNAMGSMLGCGGEASPQKNCLDPESLGANVADIAKDEGPHRPPLTSLPCAPILHANFKSHDPWL